VWRKKSLLPLAAICPARPARLRGAVHSISRIEGDEADQRREQAARLVEPGAELLDECQSDRVEGDPPDHHQHAQGHRPATAAAAAARGKGPPRAGAGTPTTLVSRPAQGKMPSGSAFSPTHRTNPPRRKTEPKSIATTPTISCRPEDPPEAGDRFPDPSS